MKLQQTLEHEAFQIKLKEKKFVQCQILDKYICEWVKETVLIIIRQINDYWTQTVILITPVISLS